MNRIFIILLLSFLSIITDAQSTFKVIFKTYKTGAIIRTYEYNYSFKNDAFGIQLADSIITHISVDSMVIMEEIYAFREKLKKTVNYFNTKKQLIKTEHFIEDYLYETEEWKYDTFRRIIYQSVNETGASDRSYLRTYSFKNAKTNEGTEEIEYCNFNNSPEYCTTNYYDRKHVRYKQIRQNDEGKTIHIETYNYNPLGKLTEREVYFPEFGVTKYFKEPGTNPKCYRYTFLGPEKINEENMEMILKRELLKNKVILLANDCDDLEYKFTNLVNSITIKKQQEHNKRAISVSIKEKIKQQP